MKANKIKVYVTCDWETDEELFKIIGAYGFGAHTWKNIEFTLNSDYDRIIILRGLNKDSKKYNPDKAITFFTEPSDSKENLRHETKCIQSFIAIPWWNYIKTKNQKYIQQIGGIRKTKLLSSVTSNNFYLEGHQKRVELLVGLDSFIDEGLDVFGRDPSEQFSKIIKSHRGALLDKYDGLWRYKYHFACENSFLDDYYTEKIVDPIIAECLCFYDGCTNISEFIDDRAYVKINVANPEDAINTIIETIENDEWKKRIKYIRQQKERLLHHLNPLNIIYMAVNEMNVLEGSKL